MEKKTYSVYVHKVETENGPYYYTGVSDDPKKRWRPSGYIKCSKFYEYIQQYGWENIEHAVIADGLSNGKGREIEDMLICMYTSLGRCLNRRRSGHISTDKIAYEHIRMTNDNEYADRQREINKLYKRRVLETPAGKIYNRVKNYNHQHPDRMTETALAAKRKYLESGYIPDYIKNDDLQ